MKLISVTMKLFFWEKFHCDLKRWKMGRFKSLRFDFCVFNFDTMKVILFGKAPKSLMVSYFWQKEKERKYRINTCVPIWSEWGDSNSRHLAPKASALPPALHLEMFDFNPCIIPIIQRFVNFAKKFWLSTDFVIKY